MISMEEAMSPSEEITGRALLVKERYLKLSKFFLLIFALLLIWMVFVLGSIYFLDMGYRWLALSPEEWIYTFIGLLGFFIILEIIFVLHYTLAKRPKVEPEQPEPVYQQGKQRIEFTYPHHIHGGIFSKTYITIDDNTILNLRTLMIAAKDLWGKHEE
jgi:hypothetical protein